jgi:hypothetical protein
LATLIGSEKARSEFIAILFRFVQASSANP